LKEVFNRSPVDLSGTLELYCPERVSLRKRKVRNRDNGVVNKLEGKPVKKMDKMKIQEIISVEEIEYSQFGHGRLIILNE